MLSTCVIVLLFFIIIYLLLTCITSKKCFGFGGGKSTQTKKRKHFYENIWDDDCLDDNPELDDMLDLYEENKIGKKLRKFLKWYKPTYSSKCIYEYLVKEGFNEYDVKLQVSGRLHIDLTGKTYK